MILTSIYNNKIQADHYQFFLAPLMGATERWDLQLVH